MSTLRWQWCTLHELSAKQLYAVLVARSAVFVVEQNCAYQDADGYDIDAEHVMVWAGDDVAAYLRVLAPGTKFSERSIGRIITTQAFRGTGLGRQLIAHALERLDAAFPAEPVRIGAQARLERFYESFGFHQASDVYMEDGIPHIEMLRAAAAPPPEAADVLDP
jgi:ElaA protein